ncbi:MAG: winged helix-turn-helix domain-containing protein [Spirochaetales bacterium]|nr:winged helix-turn-helix domain-containing protein [Spirochaetales bacterium]MCF7937728.1 winged helix-turn-helix domain-containing protein [Spirochaetales bacterium]
MRFRSIRVDLVRPEPAEEAVFRSLFRKQPATVLIVTSSPMPVSQAEILLLSSSCLREISPIDSPGLPVLVYGPAEDLPEAFQEGAGDFLREPWSEIELMIRIERMVDQKRSCGPYRLEGNTMIGPPLFGGSGEQRVQFTPAEAAIMALLFAGREETVSRHLIENLAFSGKNPKSKRFVDVHIAGIRKKLASAYERPPNGPVILTIRGSGYLLHCPNT